MIPEEWYKLCVVAILCTGLWARDGGVDPCWRILLHVLSIVSFFVLCIADIVMQMS
jgi:hypothetical protein